MKKILMVISLVLVGLSIATNSHAARVDCPVAKVVHIQVEGKKILYLQAGAPWRTLGYLGNNDGTEERYAAMLAAQTTDKSILVGYYIDNYDCSRTNYSTAATIVRTH